MKKQIILLFIFLLGISSTYGQSHLSVDLDHPVYRIIEIAEIKGAVKNLSLAKPYSLSMVISILKEAVKNRDCLNNAEQKMLDRMLVEFEKPDRDITPASISLKGYLGSLFLGIEASGRTRFDVSTPGAWHMDNAVSFYMKGDIGSFLSYYGSFGFTFDRVDADTFMPYSFTKEWDGFHLGFGDPRYSLDGEEPLPYFSFKLRDELAMEFFENRLLLRLARIRRDWGPSSENLYLSGTARPYEGIDICTQLSPNISLSSTFGSLSDWQKELLLKTDPDALTFQRMLTLQMIEFFPFDWLTFSTAASAVWGKRFEIGYLNPLMYPIIHQNLHGDFDNVIQSVNVIAKVPGYARFYLTFLADEMELTNLGDFFTSPRNMVAYQLGLKVPLPVLPFSLITLRYTKIEPFVYSHYPGDGISSSSYLVDLSYTHDGENLGSPLAPNSDEFLVSTELPVLPELTLSLAYRLIRHGTNSSAIEPIAIFGDIDEYFDYTQLALYPDKVFLKDGLYDWNNIITLEAEWNIPEIHSIIKFGYGFSYTWWMANDSGITPPEDRMRNVFSFGYKVFY